MLQVTIRHILLLVQSAICIALICMIFLAQVFAALPAGTQIVNNAQVNFISHGSAVSINATHVAIVNSKTPSSVKLSRIVEQSGNNTESFTVLGTQCLNNQQWAQLPAPIYDGLEYTIGQSANATNSAVMRSGTPLFITLTDLDQNRDQNAVEWVEVQLLTKLGDRETLRLLETGSSTGIFRGYIPTKQQNVVSGNCTLDVNNNGEIRVEYSDSVDQTDNSQAKTSVDPLSRVFDSQTGAGVAGAIVEIFDAKTGQLMTVPDFDGAAQALTGSAQATATLVPARYITSEGSAETAGQFRIPILPAGEYRFVVTAPKSYVYPSTASLSQLQQVNTFSETISTASLGAAFVVKSKDDLVLVDLALDRSLGRLELTKTTTATVVAQGDVIDYQVMVRNSENFAINNLVLQDQLPIGVMLAHKVALLQINQNESKRVPIQVDATGRNLKIAIDQINSKQSLQLNYKTYVTATAPMGEAVNTAIVEAQNGLQSNQAQASVIIKDDLMSTQAILVGRVFDACPVANSSAQTAKGVAGVRIQLEDGRYNLSDSAGRWHFENVTPGTHVVHIDPSSIPEGYEAVGCNAGLKASQSAMVQMVDLKPGTLWQVNFVLQKKVQLAELTTLAPVVTTPASNDVVKTDSGTVVSGLDENWLAQQSQSNEIVFPSENFIPITSAVGFAVKYTTGQQVRVLVNGQAAPSLSYDGVVNSAANKMSVATWRALPIKEGKNTITVVLTERNRQEQQLTRDVYYSSVPAYAQIITSKSQLIADAKSPIQLAIQLKDAFKRPLREGMTGRISVEGQFVASELVDPSRRDPLAKTPNAELKFVVGKNGIAIIPFQPAAAPGPLIVKISLANGRSEILKTWVEAAQRDWFLVGLAETTITTDKLRQRLESLQGAPGVEALNNQDRVAFYAVGSIRGDTLLTIAYDSDKNKTQARDQLAQAVRSDEYYLVYADNSVASNAALSSDKLYLRLDRKGMSAVYGDFATEMGQGKLNNYYRALTGVKAEYRGEIFEITAFAAQTGAGIQHDEIALDGTTGRYQLKNRAIVPGTERISLQARQQDLSQRVVQSRTLARFIDYRIDYRTGEITLTALPFVLPATRLILVADYETENQSNQEKLVMGGRVQANFSLTPNAPQRSEVGLNVYQDDSTGNSGRLVGLDTELHLNDQLRLKAEVAQSERMGQSKTEANNSANAWSLEAIQQGQRHDLRVYTEKTDANFGLGQAVLSSTGLQQSGLDAKYKINDVFSLVSNLQHTTREGGSTVSGEDTTTQVANLSLLSTLPLPKYINQRFLAQLELGGKFAQEDQAEARQQSDFLNAGLRFARRDGQWNTAILTEQAIRGDGLNTVPERIMATADYKLGANLNVVAAHEVLMADDQKAQLSKVGLKYSPNLGGSIFADIGQAVSDSGQAVPLHNVGFDYRYVINPHWSIDAGYLKQSWLDAGRLIQNEIKEDVLPSGYMDQFDSYALGFNYKQQDWTVQTKLEYRQGVELDRQQAGIVIYKKLSDGLALSAAANGYSEQGTEQSRQEKSVSFAWSYRHDEQLNLADNFNQWVLLQRLDLIEQETQFQDTSKQILADNSKKILNNIHLNWYLSNDHQLSLHYGAKYVVATDILGEFRGLTQFASSEYRYQLKPYLDVGSHVFAALSKDISSKGYGMSLGIKPVPRSWLSVGYNFVGLNKGLFDEADYTAEGWYVKLRLRFDQDFFHLNRLNGVKTSKP